mgnify:CR=1 FL=1
MKYTETICTDIESTIQQFGYVEKQKQYQGTVVATIKHEENNNVQITYDLDIKSNKTLPQCQISNCNKPSNHTRVETMQLDDESIKIDTNLCELHSLVVNNGDWNDWSIIKS